MPATSIRDLVLKDDDIVVGTHGRSFWILDDITPLRQLTPHTASAGVTLFRPQVATRFRWNKGTDTPLPPEEPAGQNPPDGAIIDYVLPSGVSASDVKLDILDATGSIVRRYASTDTAEAPADIGNVPAYWIRPTQVLPATAGMHRFVWDLRGERPAVLSFSYPIAAIYGDTPREPRGIWAMPGTYTVRLTVAGKTYTQPLTVRMDPRVKTPRSGLAQQFSLSRRLTDLLRRDRDALTELRSLRAQAGAAGGATQGDAKASFDRKAAALQGQGGGFGGGGAGGGGESFARLNGELASLLNDVQEADRAPTTALVAAGAELERTLSGLQARLAELRTAARELLGGR
jgi:hypothetical protein